jgi:predicted nucleic-acid-binding Zn-ribbon protein
VSVSCRNCGYTEIYNPEVLEGKKHLGSILDVLFGG